MSTRYLETSALLAWLLGEPKGGRVVEAIDGAKNVVTSALTVVEAQRTLVRAENRGVISAGDAQRLIGLLRRARAGWIHMEVTAEVRARASRSFPVEPVRTLDAIHLATALTFVKAFPDLSMLSFDRRVIDNSVSLGIA